MTMSTADPALALATAVAAAADTSSATLTAILMVTDHTSHLTQQYSDFYFD